MKYFFIISYLFFSLSLAQNARKIVKKSNDLLRGVSSYSLVTMKIIKPDWSREMQMKVWSLEPDFSLVYMTSPARDKGSVTLKRKTEVWNWLPSVQRVIKIPPSMMLQSWMGSDFTNDDLVRESSIIEDYEHSVVGNDTIEGLLCWKIQLIPKPEAGVVWGKIIMWISHESYMQLKSDYYDEDGILIKSMLGSDIKKMDGRLIPAHWEMIPVDKPGQKTVFIYDELKFDIKINKSFFSQQNMKRVR
jgi:outer membrane lipoprotein-sorting protein